jgi:hypothetical protein
MEYTPPSVILTAQQLYLPDVELKELARKHCAPWMDSRAERDIVAAMREALDTVIKRALSARL